MEAGKQNSKTLKALMLPWLAHGHSTPFLELSKRLAIRNFHIYFCSTPVNLASIKKKIPAKLSSSIELVEYHLPSTPELPPHYHTTNGLPPHLMTLLLRAYKAASPQFSDILKSLKPDLVIYDYIQDWAPRIASEQGIPAVQFLAASAAFVAFRGRPADDFPEIFIRDYWAKNLGSGEVDVAGIVGATEKSHKILLVRASREIEGKYMDFLSKTSNKKVVPTGLLVEDFNTNKEEDDDYKEIMEWLDQKEKGSAVYVSFGMISMEENKQSSKLVKVLMLPWLAHGHTSPFLELAKRLATRNFHIYICSTPVLLNSIKKKVTEKFSSSIELVELHLPSSSELPPHYHTTNGLPPHLMITLKKAYEMSVPQFTDILTSLQPDLLVYDFIQYWAAEIALSKSIPAVHFMTFGASIISFGLHFMKNPGKEFPYPELYIRDYEWNKMKGQHEVEYNNSLSDRDRFLRAVELSQKILLVKSSPEIDGKYFDLLSEITNKKAVPVGHLVQEPTPEDDRDEDEEIVSWLDHKEKGSVLYVSFGSEYFLTKEERDVVSRALELSNVNFIWVIRFPQGEQIRIQEALPEGFLDRVGNRGKLVEGWAPQAKILKHPSTGAFENKQNAVLKVLMLPWLAHGHTSPFLELAKRLATRNFHIYICSTPVILNSFKKKVTDKYSSSIELVELHLPSSPELPSQYHTTNGLPPHLMISLKKAYEMSIPQFTNFLTSLLPDLVIYDFNQYWAAEIAWSLDIPAVQFMTAGASLGSYAVYKMKNFGKEFPCPELYLRDYELMKLRSIGDVEFNNVSDRERFHLAVEKSQKILLVKSSVEIDGRFFNVLSDAANKKVVPVGPLVQESTPEDDRDEDEEIISWLDQKEKCSVLYASFGSEYFLTKEERDVISEALEISNVNFIWVLRIPKGERISVQEALPEGFLDRVGNRGKLVGGWAPQAKILKHRSTGAFVSHCGWSSVMESIVWGVPIIAMPMQLDQPLNARVVEAVGVGVEAVRDESGDLQSGEIARVIRKVMVDESGEDVRKKSKELSEALERKGDEEIDALVPELLFLCQKK
ncbi:OLC1v1026274C1 [Oldenlandia corymbosa var. corymbosa]|uniref:OLC1v1026274C1 n=1 Tax=Oldenlandia corymbosa var. corymbosa TaxID=529605 RepID=A0AAV1C760_OLDCO|nr:OLC1v1026274C1 [Oldenlandia corymbosa var. corymbosa]